VKMPSSDRITIICSEERSRPTFVLALIWSYRAPSLRIVPMKGVNIVLGLLGGAGILTICHQIWIHKEIRDLRYAILELSDYIDQSIGTEEEETFQDLVERYREDS
jgi:hypothetical protein